MSLMECESGLREIKENIFKKKEGKKCKNNVKKYTIKN